MECQVKGYSIIEVLVAMVILVVGLIGLFNLHLVAKRGSFESFQQTRATTLANDIINRMRLNPLQLKSYAGTYVGTLAAPEPCEQACSIEQSRLWDLYQWEQSLLGSAEQLDEKNIGGLDTPIACIGSKDTGEVLVVLTWRGIREVSDTADSGFTNEDDMSFIHSCGKDQNDSGNNRRRVYAIHTFIGIG